VRETGSCFADEGQGDGFDESMASAGAGIVESRAEWVGSGFSEIFELVADEKSHQVGHPEASYDPRCAVADSRRVVEGRVEVSAGDFNAGSAVTGEESVEPMRRAVERAAKIE